MASAGGGLDRYALASNVEGFLDQLGVERAMFVGASLGGITSLTIAAVSPARVRGDRVDRHRPPSRRRRCATHRRLHDQTRELRVVGGGRRRDRRVPPRTAAPVAGAFDAQSSTTARRPLGVEARAGPQPAYRVDRTSRRCTGQLARADRRDGRGARAHRVPGARAARPAQRRALGRGRARGRRPPAERARRDDQRRRPPRRPATTRSRPPRSSAASSRAPAGNRCPNRLDAQPARDGLTVQTDWTLSAG